MKKIAAVVLLVAVLALAAPAAASPPMDVHIEVIVTNAGGTNTGPFSTTGSALNNGVICSNGNTVDLDFQVKSLRRGEGIHVILHRKFTCADGSGTFIMNLTARILFDPREVSGRWNILSGTGAYENLHGSGALTDSEIQSEVPFIVLDLLDGRLNTK